MRRALAVGVCVGLAAAIAILFVAIDHNPQNEFLDEGGEPTQALATLGAIWFVVAGVSAGLFTLIAGWLTSDRSD
ncbi:hypothetical protein [Erythrobacter crassostreae]|uniref:Uncharacterized protein n=1 Tax=Erythrobacter crassostreae TaxID=2828328 RepID=A0A9X1F352_9SPHN|nr:hypothetical protein [Erythrobacter crassostrea]MBV7259407.1 hypothetical protein [Erythrobacter crassostrea]